MSNHMFEIGLTGAGAVSAGAYTGGVIDFMIQALDCWYAAKETDTSAPPHEVKLRVFSGASAGGITAALTAAYISSDQPPVTNEEEARSNNGKNKLFDAWVDRVDISSLLETRDLKDKQSPVISLLDSSILPEIVKSSLDVTPRISKRPYIADDFELILTVTNLRGVPYAFDISSNRPEPSRYDMLMHADYMHFRITDSEAGCPPDRCRLKWNEISKSDSLGVAALASGAFPGGLAPHTLSRPRDVYNLRTWPVPDCDNTAPHHCIADEPIHAKWGTLPAGIPYEFQGVDGGVINNEPLELARKILAGPRGRNCRDGKSADKAVLLIDPFPANAFFDSDYKADPGLLNTLLSLFEALINQVRFKPDELMLAAKDDVYSRFMIAPVRDGAAYPLACGALGGFGGFLKRDFRSHDYFLGRRNMQKFLRDHFVLPENNALFTEWTEEMKQTYCVRNLNNQPKTESGLRLLPIIPLTGQARTVCYQAEWPSYTNDDLNKLIKQVKSRTDTVLDRLVKQSINSRSGRIFARIAIFVEKKRIMNFIRQKAASDLTKMGLMK